MDELAELKAEVQRLREEVAALRDAAPPQRLPLERGSAPATAHSRRHVLRHAAAAAAGVAAASVALPGRAAAAPASANGQPITFGEINQGTATTELKLPSGATDVFSHVLAVQDGVWSTPRVPSADLTPEAGTQSAVGGFAGGAAMHGGYFQTNSPIRGSAGLRARGENAASYGVWAAGRRAAIRLERLPLQFPPEERADSHNEGEILIDDNSDLWYCRVGGTPGQWVKLAGLSTAGQLHPITPARVYDSRFMWAVTAGVGPLVPGEGRTIYVGDAYVVNSSTPSIWDVVPNGATAIAYNLTIAETGPAGYLSVNPGDAPSITASSINWSAPGTVLANASVVKLDEFRQLRVFCQGSPTHAIIDVVGYYR